MDLNNSPLTGALEIAFNRFLSLNPEAQQECSKLSGKHIAVQLKNTDFRIDFLPNAQGVQLGVNTASEPNATIEAGVFELAQLALAQKQQTSTALSSGLRISGDMDLAQQFQGLLQQVDFDWEELLAKYLGDIGAAQLGNGLRSFLGFGQNIAKALASNTADFIQNEKQDVAEEAEVKAFCDDVDTLRDDVARLEARLLRLELVKK